MIIVDPWLVLFSFVGRKISTPRFLLIWGNTLKSLSLQSSLLLQDMLEDDKSLKVSIIWSTWGLVGGVEQVAWVSSWELC